MEFETALSRHDEESITVRSKDLTSEVMDEMSFPSAVLYLWTGEEPTAGESRLADAILSCLMVHGTTASAIASRMTVRTEPNAPQAAIASGILGVGSQFIGTMKECAEELHRIADTDDPAGSVEALPAEYRSRGERFSGIGHRVLTPVDPRAERLFAIAREEGIAGEYVALLEQIQGAFEAETGATLPINATGAIAAVTADMGLSPTAARGLAVLSRAAGVTGEMLEEHEHPMSPDILRVVDENVTDPQ